MNALTFNKPEIDLAIQETADGLLISQHGKSCLARSWRLTDQVVDIIETALANGLTCLFRQDHPQAHKLLPANPKGVDYIGFSRKPNERWMFVLDYYSCHNKKKGSPRLAPYQVTFYMTYQPDLLKHGIPFEMRNSPKARGGFVPVEYLQRAIDACLHNYGITGRYGGKKGMEQPAVQGFLNESSLQARLINHLAECDFGDKLRFVDQEVILGDNRIDILAEIIDRNRLVVLELKYPHADSSAVEQVSRYMQALSGTSIAAGKQIVGGVVAGSVYPSARLAIDNSSFSIQAFEASWRENGVDLRKVAGSWDTGN